MLDAISYRTKYKNTGNASKFSSEPTDIALCNLEALYYARTHKIIMPQVLLVAARDSCPWIT